LLETVIVIAIIAILMALFYPCCVKAIQMARGTVSRVSDSR
jgi:Tfp pilus assembly protein FimT